MLTNQISDLRFNLESLQNNNQQQEEHYQNEVQRKTFVKDKETEQYNTLVEAIKDLNRQYEELNLNAPNNIDDVKVKREKIRGEIGKLQSEIDKLARDLENIGDDKSKLAQEINDILSSIEEKNAKLPQLRDNLVKTKGIVYNLEVNRDAVRKELDQLKKNLSDEELLEEN